MILILEDNSERRDRFKAVLKQLGWGDDVRFWVDSPSMCSELQHLLPKASLISLDHDLDADPQCPDDPGSGMDVVELLVQQPPGTPVIVHTTNVPAAELMMYLLENAGWRVVRVGPLLDDWIESDWAAAVESLI